MPTDTSALTIPADHAAPPTTPLRSPGSRRARPVSLSDLTFDELAERVAELGAPRYRATQLAEWVYRHLASDYAAMTNLPAPFREQLAEVLPLSLLSPVRELVTDDGETVKTLYRTFDGQFVET